MTGQEWWRQPEECPWLPEEPRELIIPGRPEEHRDFDKWAQPVTQSDFRKVAEGIRSRLSGGWWPPPPPDDDYLERGGMSGGTDACAFYRSFRYCTGFGIHVCVECWASLAKWIYCHGVLDEAAVDEAFALLYRHELFHFAVDRTSLYLERVVELATGVAPDLWFAYHRRNRPSRLEEALANAFAFEHAGKRWAADGLEEIIKLAVGRLMKAQPLGYCDFEDAMGGAKSAARAQLLNDILRIDRRSHHFVPDMALIWTPPSLRSRDRGYPSMRFEGRPLGLYFY